MDKKLGPNVKNLIFRKMSLIMIPPGCDDGKGAAFLKGVEGLTKTGVLISAAKQAGVWVHDAIAAVKNAPGGDAYGDDEAIAGEILKRIEERK